MDMRGAFTYCGECSRITTGQLPDKEGQCTSIKRGGLIPTAEVPVTNFFRDEILSAKSIACQKMCTPCFRREAGSWGKDVRGLNRAPINLTRWN